MARWPRARLEFLDDKGLFGPLFSVLMVVLLCIFFGLGYVAGRTSPCIESARKSEPQVSAAAQSPPPEIATPAIPPPLETAKPADVSPVPKIQPPTEQTFLQVSAVPKAEAEILAERLMKKGFQAMVAPGPSDNIYRVLVGPAKDTAELDKMKSDLELAGLKSIARKY